TYGYDADARQVLMVSPMLEDTRYYFDVDARQVAVTDPSGYTSDSLLDDDSRVQEAVDNDANVTLFSHDAMSRLLGQQVYNADGGPLVSSQGWTYDLAGTLLTETDGDNNVTHYHYDQAYRLQTTKVYDSVGILVHQT